MAEGIDWGKIISIKVIVLRREPCMKDETLNGVLVGQGYPPKSLQSRDLYHYICVFLCSHIYTYLKVYAHSQYKSLQALINYCLNRSCITVFSSIKYPLSSNVDTHFVLTGII